MACFIEPSAPIILCPQGSERITGWRSPYLPQGERATFYNALGALGALDTKKLASWRIWSQRLGGDRGSRYNSGVMSNGSGVHLLPPACVRARAAFGVEQKNGGPMRKPTRTGITFSVL